MQENVLGRPVPKAWGWPVPGGGSPDELGAYLRSEIDKFGKVVRATGLRLE